MNSRHHTLETPDRKPPSLVPSIPTLWMGILDVSSRLFINLKSQILRHKSVIRILKVCSRLSNLNLAGVRLSDQERRRVSDAAKDGNGACQVVFDYELEPKIWGIPIFSS